MQYINIAKLREKLVERDQIIRRLSDRPDFEGRPEAIEHHRVVFDTLLTIEQCFEKKERF